MGRLLDDLAGAIYDFLKFILKSISYLLAGGLIVGALMYIVVFFFSFMN
ncbi:hypothetical protein [Metabacillus iocasae]|uniref:Uncharacterized protein n=1 Tax=Priestia iocasae TaxID=2291674 RepID=A0ABS2QVH6_9BACI|nr:hypothetical protein [Metabacillus iocasae]MBM7702942.1 hypothetical protein [Metabacillus iocasae]